VAKPVRLLEELVAGTPSNGAIRRALSGLTRNTNFSAVAPMTVSPNWSPRTAKDWVAAQTDTLNFLDSFKARSRFRAGKRCTSST
jgi:hypothetical protein